MFAIGMNNKLVEIACNAHVVSEAHTDISRKTFVHQVALIDIPAISEYVAIYLSKKTYLRSRVRIPELKRALPNLKPEEIAKSKRLLEAHREIHGAFFHISKILEEYFNDLYLACMHKDQEAQSQAKGFEGEAAKQTLQSELLPQMIARLLENFENPNPDTFAKGLKEAFKHDAFGRKRECPFSRKIATLFALQPLRTQEDVVIILDKKTPGALPMFIYRELLGAQYLIENPNSSASFSHASP